MPLDFLDRYGGRRLGRYPEEAPPPVEQGAGGEPDEPVVQLHIERPENEWAPIDSNGAEPQDGEWPARFIDGCYHGETIAWLRDAEKHPIPLRLAEIGGVCLRTAGRSLARETAVIERIVATIVDPFPWDEVESFAAALSGEGYRLLPVPLRAGANNERVLGFDLRVHREWARMDVLHEMEVLEELALCEGRGVPTLVDGRLGKYQRCGLDDWDVIGVIKRHAVEYLHPAGHRVLLDLAPGDRTPAFGLPSKHLDVVSWYLKLDGAHGAMPDWGVVRVEVPQAAVERHGGFAYLDRLSKALVRLRCRSRSYARAPVSLEPIVRAEESLKSLLSPLPLLTQRFYRFAGL